MWAAQLGNFSGDPRAGLQLAQRAVIVVRQLGDRAALARALEIVGFALGELGDSNGALTVLLEAVDIARGTGNNRRIGNALHSLARATEDSGDPRTAERLYWDALEALRDAGERWRRFEVMFDLGRLAIEGGNIDAARARFEEIAEEFRPPWSLWMSVTLGGLAEVARLQGQMALAQQYVCDSLEWALKSGDRIGMAAALVICAQLLASRRQTGLATHMHAAVTAWRTRGNVSTLGGPFRWVVPGLRKCDADLQALRRALGDEDFTTAWTVGGRISLEEAIAEAHTVLCSGSA